MIDLTDMIEELNNDINPAYPLDKPATEFMNDFLNDLLTKLLNYHSLTPDIIKEVLPGKLADRVQAELARVQDGEHELLFNLPVEIINRDPNEIQGLSTILEYITAEILQLTGEVHRSRLPEDEEGDENYDINLPSIKEAMENDLELRNLFLAVYQ